MLNLRKMMIALVFGVSVSVTYAHELDQHMQQKLIADGKVADFDFKDFHVSTLVVLLKNERGIRVEISPLVNQDYEVQFKMKGLTFLEFLKQGADRLNLKAIQLDQHTIQLRPK